MIGEQGEAVERIDGLGDSELLKMHQEMVLIRTLDARCLVLQRQGRIGFYVPSTGEEALQVGSVFALTPNDWVVPAYREPGVFLHRGFSLRDYLCQLYGNAEDLLKGRQMPNHFAYGAGHCVSVSSPVGTQIPHAVGIAMAARIRKDPSVTIVYFGDGATSQGDFHVSMNFAGVFRSPVIFLCKNNQWAISVPLGKQTASETIAQKGLAYGFDGIRVDGNDVLAVYQATKEAAERARAGEGPTLIEAVTYRLGPHSSSDDPTRYRSVEEVEAWKRKDPITRLETFLIQKGITSEAQVQRVRQETEERINNQIKEVEAIGPPSISSMFQDVYAEVPWHLQEELEFIAKEPRGELKERGEFPL